MIKKQIIKRFFFLSPFFVLLYLMFALSVNNSLTNNDINAIKSLGLELECRNTEEEFDREISCILAIQKAVQSIENEKCALANEVIEPSEFLQRNYGCCYDRARFIEKSARYFGFETRRVFLIKPVYGISLANLLPLGQISHGTSEIFTSKGWMGVDSVKPFILTNHIQEPVTFRSAINQIDEYNILKPDIFFTGEIDVIYGLYSRHGNFHGRNFPGPEYVFSELLMNFR